MRISLEPSALTDLLNFLEKVHKAKLCAKDEFYLTNAWRRYEELWIPLVRKYGNNGVFLKPPLDVHWMWHLHFHHPRAYHRDLASTGAVLDHRYSKDNVSAISAWTKEYPNESFDPPNDSQSTKKHLQLFQSNFSYDLLEASKRQKDFLYQVSLPHYRDKRFQVECINRYEMFLGLKSKHPNQFIVPYYDIDLAWHAHMSKPILYNEETSYKLGGLMLDHNDSVERSGLTDSHKRTAELWKELYYKDYRIPGVAHRGDPPHGKLLDGEQQMSSFFNGIMKEVMIHPFIYLSLPSPTKKPIEYTLSLRVSEWHSLGKKCLLEYQITSESSSNLSYILLFDAKAQKQIGVSAYSSIIFEIDVRRKTKSKSIPILFSNSKPQYKYISGFYKKLDMAESNEEGNLRLKSYCKKYLLQVHFKYVSERIFRNGPLRRVVKILPGSNYDCIIPERIESLWGPIPLRKLPEGQDNNCKAIVHRILDNKDNFLVFTVHLVHSLAHGMSCVQMFLGSERMSVAHIVDSETLSINHLEACKRFKYSLWRGMIIKDAHGDWGLLIGHWTGTRCHSPGYFSCLFINLRSKEEINFNLPNEVSTVFDGEVFSIHIPNKISINLSTGEIVYHSGIENEIIPYTTLGFAMSVLYLLVLPTPQELDAPKPLNIPAKYEPLFFRSLAPMFFVCCGIECLETMPANSTLYHKRANGFLMLSDLSNAYSNIPPEQVSVDLTALSTGCFDNVDSSVFGSVVGNFEGFEGEGLLGVEYGGVEFFGYDLGNDGGAPGDGGMDGGGDGGGCGGGCGG